MSTEFNITFSDAHRSYHARIVEDVDSPISIGTRHYAVDAPDEDMAKVVAFLRAMGPEQASAAAILPGRVSKADVCITEMTRRIAAVSPLGKPALPPSRWLANDGEYLTRIKNQFATVYLNRENAHPELLKDFLMTGTEQKSTVDEFERRFDAAIAGKDGDSFLLLLDHVSAKEMAQLVRWEKINIRPAQFQITPEALTDLDAYVEDPNIGFSGVVAVQAGKTIHSAASIGVKASQPFAIHSVGKVFTGVLALRLIQAGIISEAELDKPIQLSAEVLSALPQNVQEHLAEKKPTLQQLMLHQAGLGDYLGKYKVAIAESVLAGVEPPAITRPEDFLPFAEEDTFPVGEKHYSNLGMVLVGLSLQNLAKRPFDQLLQEYVVGPSHMEAFSSKRPPNGRSNAEDVFAEHMCGGPAGGYWTTAQDLCGFGHWLSMQCIDRTFYELLQRRGGEFYHSESDTIEHQGAIPSASAYLTVFPKKGVAIAVVSDKPGAVDMNDAVKSYAIS